MKAFVVINDDLGTATVLTTESTDKRPDVPVEGILTVTDTEATAFPTREAAAAAVNRTWAYFTTRKTPSRKRPSFHILPLVRP